MTLVQNRKAILYRPNDDVKQYLDQLKEINPEISMNNRVDSLVRYAINSLKGKQVVLEMQTVIRDSEENK